MAASAISCRSRASARIGSSTRRSSTRCTTMAPSQSFFNRLDAHSASGNAFHLNVQAARSSFDVPNTLDAQESAQDQHQKITTYNVAPAYTGIIGSSALFTANVYASHDHLTYTPAQIRSRISPAPSARIAS